MIRSLIRWAVASSLCLAGCATSQRDTGLEGVAKEWSKAIRASQVIPIYPLTEDLQVGDVYVTDFASGDEPESWQKDGYLPLPQLHTRLMISGETFANEMYRDGQYGLVASNGTFPRLPQFFQMNNGATTMPVKPVTAAPAADGMRQSRRDLQNWKRFAPQVSFPSYSVKVGSSFGGSVGVPVQGIPVALGLLNSQTATASVSLEECYVYGLSNLALYNLAKEEIAKPDGAFAPQKLVGYAPAWTANNKGEFHKRYRYLRAITRVYTVGRIRVTVDDETKTAGQVKVGLDHNLALLDGAGDPGAKMRSILDVLNHPGTTSATGAPSTQQGATAPANAKPGESQTAEDMDTPLGVKMQFVNVSDRSITLTEDFDRPLVIGYNAIDLPIGADGSLGNVPIDTFQANLLGDGGYVELASDINQWVLLTPDAAARLQEWAKTSENQTWLKNAGFSDLAVHPEKLPAFFTSLRGMGKFFMIPFWMPAHELEQRITEDLLRAPPGFDRDNQGRRVDARTYIQKIMGSEITTSEKPTTTSNPAQSSARNPAPNTTATTDR